MRVFVTGATGYIGSAVVDALQRASHEVVALVRHQAKARRLADRGVESAVGTLGNPSTWRQQASTCTGFVHAAFEQSPKGVEIDRIALDTLVDLARAAGERGPASFIYTSGIWVLGSSPEPVDETAPLHPTDLVAWRPAHEQLVLDTASDTLRAAVIRPGIVYGGAHGIVSDLLASAENGLMRIVGSGENHWPLVYDRDLADLYARVLVSDEGRGVFHATDGADEQVRTIAEAIVEHRPHPPDIRFVPLAEARAKMGPYADALALDQRIRSPRAHALGWNPSLRSVSGNIPRLFEELRRGRARQQQEQQDS
ncbi:MAG: NAD-dependent epimerase/dehydratase family protein [Acidobacteria bacterium]|nr:NAD-dependent epimerase/dehydratase family protein [Acidobacteriota bacterium]